ncbi:uncharacterized protein LOC111403877 [Olea europaea var. sylvestris]|uniref:uncharacterized protein LOC111403877 n=1 Tax=Olea europaea var. sylvestris TaxID=158386 RepID=UPI000C1D5471|nr:uncharacterized protein LOC111403877 [Olea europaea var. sylvestris]
MRFTAKAKNGEGWGMGFLLVLFPEEDHQETNKKRNSSINNNLFASPSSSHSFKPLNTLLKRTNSAYILHKTQSTISICALLLFITLLLFTVSTLPSTTTAAARARRQYGFPRRQLSLMMNNSSSTSDLLSTNQLSHALQGMGTLYRRGTRAMSDLIVAHAVESLTSHELKLFLRLLYRSSLTSRSDLVLLFPSKSKSPDFDNAILQEDDSFLKLVTQYAKMNRSAHSMASFDVTQFVKMSKKERQSGEPIWGRRIRSNFSEEGKTESTPPSYGSVVSFDMEELDQENSLAGLLEHVPMNLRRWACYPMLLGRVRRNFKHIVLVDVKEMLLVGDPLGRVRNQSPESVHLSSITHSHSTKHGKKKSDKTQSTRQKSFNPAIIMGGARGVRRLSNAMFTEIARAAMQHKKKNLVTELGLFNQLVGNEFILKNVKLIPSAEPIPELSSLGGSNSKSDSSLSISNYSLIRAGNGNSNVNAILMKHICSSTIDSEVYSDC